MFAKLIHHCHTWGRNPSPLSNRQFTVIVGLIVASYILHGIMLMGVLPPLEGFDEYQHLAYIAHLNEHRTLPIYGQTPVPDDVWHAARSVPQPRNGAVQVGGPTYAQWWHHQRTPDADTPRLHIYQSQHPPLYYALMAPIYRLCGGVSDLPTTVAVLRFINILFGALTLIVLALAWRRVFPDAINSLHLLLFMAVHPLLLINTTRIANDALAILLGTIVIALCFTPALHRTAWKSAALGLLLGIATMAKATNLILIPFALIALFVAWRTQKSSWKHQTAALLIACVCFIVVVLPYHLYAFRTYGMFIPMNEHLMNHASSQDMADMLVAAKTIQWHAQLQQWWGTLFVGGWSFLTTGNLFTSLYRIILAAGLLAALLSYWRHRHDRPQLAPYTAGLMFFMTAALAYHAIQSFVAHGAVATGAWYAALVLPWMFAAIVRTLHPANHSSWWADCFVTAMSIISLSAQGWGILRKQLPIYADTHTLAVAFERLASLQPPLLGTTTVAIAGLAHLLSCLLLLAAFIFYRVNQSSCSIRAISE